jgi:hypothetical protein
LVEVEASGGRGAELNAALLELRWLMPARTELAASWLVLWEKGSWAGLGRFGPAFRFYQHPRLSARVEGGFRIWCDSVQARPGLYGGGGLTWYWAEPWISDLEASVGIVGEARVIEAAAFLGIAWKALALRGGYRVLVVDDVDLSTPMIGLAGWFGG